MTIRKTRLEGLIIIEPRVFEDNRGYFFESFRLSLLREAGYQGDFVQDNESKSNRGVIRGLHLQKPPYGQDKLLRVVKGAIYDVAVDVRKASPTYGQYVGLELNEHNKLSLFIPQGFAHGFCCLEDDTIVQYKCSNYYHKESEMGVIWNDPSINIAWPLKPDNLSEKDLAYPNLARFDSPF